MPTASPLFSAGARVKVAAGTLAVLVALVLAPRPTLVVAVGSLIAHYLCSLVYRVRRFWLGLRRGALLIVSDEDARAIADRDLPIYTVLVAAYDEPDVVARLLAELEAID